MDYDKLIERLRKEAYGSPAPWWRSTQESERSKPEP